MPVVAFADDNGVFVVLPASCFACLVGFAVSAYHDNFGYTRIGGRKAVNQVFADAISLNAFHPSGFVAQIVRILGSIRNAVMRLQL